MEKNKFMPLIGIMLICMLFFYIEYKKQSDLKKNKLTTIGKIIKLRSKFQARYSLIFEYNVDGINYQGSVGISPFVCDDGTKNCIGSEFTVYYSSKNPKNSRIDLGKYEKYKTTVEFIK